MSIMAGTPSGKFVVLAAMLIFQARVDDHQVRAALATGAPVSKIDAHLVRQAGAKASPPPPIKIGIRAMSFRARVEAVNSVEAMANAKVDLVVGQDLLDDHPVEADAAMRHSQPVELEPAGPGRWKIAAETAGLGVVIADLDLSSTAAIRTDESGRPGTGPTPEKARLGGVWLDRVDVQGAGHGRIVVGLGAFAGKSVIFDLGHNRIWIRP